MIQLQTINDQQTHLSVSIQSVSMIWNLIGKTKMEWINNEKIECSGFTYLSFVQNVKQILASHFPLY